MDLDQTLLDKAIDLFIDYRDVLGFDDESAKSATIAEIRRDQGLAEKAYASSLPSLTHTQRRVLDALRSLNLQNGFPPSVREIGAKVGLNSSSTVHAHLVALKDKGCIDFGGGPRRLRILV